LAAKALAALTNDWLKQIDLGESGRYRNFSSRNRLDGTTITGVVYPHHKAEKT